MARDCGGWDGQITLLPGYLSARHGLSVSDVDGDESNGPNVTEVHRDGFGSPVETL